MILQNIIRTHSSQLFQGIIPTHSSCSFQGIIICESSKADVHVQWHDCKLHKVYWNMW